jgi:3-oxoacyl-[acyl-carrier-protein] synthase-3
MKKMRVMHGYIKHIEYYLPEKTLTSEDLSHLFPGWTDSAIESKTGIRTRHIAAADECASDLAVAAAEKLFSSSRCKPSDIDFLVLCTQSPDFTLPTTACIVQHRLGLPITAGALDINLGCSGFVYALGLSEGLIVSGQAKSILLITTDTYSKYLDSQDKSTRAIFGDGAAATWLLADDLEEGRIGPFQYGTDGGGARNLIVHNSGTRRVCEKGTELSGSVLRKRMFMDGNAIFQFAIDTVPRAVICFLKHAGQCVDDVDLFVFHQANAYLLEEIRKALGVPREKLQITLSHCANTISSSIPIALNHAQLEGRLTDGSVVLLVGFGVGYSWGCTLVRWTDK